MEVRCLSDETPRIQQWVFFNALCVRWEVVVPSNPHAAETIAADGSLYGTASGGAGGLRFCEFIGCKPPRFCFARQYHALGPKR